jgi:GT2 family glycosyltransferase
MISVVILVHNKLELSRTCLSSLAKAVDAIDHEIFCIDNASTEDVSSLQDFAGAFGRFRFIRNDPSLNHFAIANNRAAAMAVGRYLLFLNNDVMASPTSVTALLEELERHTSIGAAGAKLVYPSKKVQHAGIVQMLWGYASNYGVGGDPQDGRFKHPCNRFAVTGAMMCLPRRVFQTVAGFDERYRWGYEDVDLCLKVRAAGYRVRYVPEAESVHEESATLSAVRDSRDLQHNYTVFRTTWDHELIPREKAYARKLKRNGVGRVVVFGTGQAALGLSKMLIENGIDIAAFTSSRVEEPGGSFCNRPVVPLESLRRMRFDRLVVASQYFFELEDLVRPYDPLAAPILPAIA